MGATPTADAGKTAPSEHLNGCVQATRDQSLQRPQITPPGEFRRSTRSRGTRSRDPSPRNAARYMRWHSFMKILHMGGHAHSCALRKHAWACLHAATTCLRNRLRKLGYAARERVKTLRPLMMLKKRARGECEIMRSARLGVSLGPPRPALPSSASRQQRPAAARMEAPSLHSAHVDRRPLCREYVPRVARNYPRHKPHPPPSAPVMERERPARAQHPQRGAAGGREGVGPNKARELPQARRRGQRQQATAQGERSELQGVRGSGGCRGSAAAWGDERQQQAERDDAGAEAGGRLISCCRPPGVPASAENVSRWRPGHP